MPMENPFWEYSLSVYALEGVAPLCVELQDNFAVDVNVLLYAAWLASGSLRLTQEHLNELEVHVSAWREQVVEPLRELRRQLRAFPTTGPMDAGPIREEIKTLELAAERQQQDSMYKWFDCSTPLPRATGATADNLALVLNAAEPERARWQPSLERLQGLLAG